MKEHENMDKIKGFVKIRLEELERLENNRAEIAEEINSLRKKSVEISGKISELQAIIDGFIVNLKQYMLYHNQYKEGWFQAVASEIALAQAAQKRILEDCEAVSNEHLQRLNLLNATTQDII